MASPSFIIFGVPRSGTSALAQAVNFEPSVFCAHERNLALAQWTFHEDMVAAAMGPPDIRGKANQQSRNTLIAKLPVPHLGDKMPEYFLRLPEIRQMHPSTRMLYIHRPASEFTASWDRLAGRNDSVDWPAGRMGLFGIFDQLIAQCVISDPAFDVVVVSHGALFLDHHYLIKSVASYLAGIETSPVLRSEFRKRFFQRLHRAEKSSIYSSLLDATGASRIDERVRSRRFFPASHLAQLFVRQSEIAAPVVAAAFEPFCASLPPDKAESVRAFGRVWVRSRRASLTGSAQSLRPAFDLIAASFPD